MSADGYNFAFIMLVRSYGNKILNCKRITFIKSEHKDLEKMLK